MNGALGHRQTGMLWRHTDEIQLNKAWLMHYIAGGDADQSNRVWFDDVVVSTKRIGCGGPAVVPTDVSPAPTTSTVPPTATSAPPPTSAPLLFLPSTASRK